MSTIRETRASVVTAIKCKKGKQQRGEYREASITFILPSKSPVVVVVGEHICVWPKLQNLNQTKAGKVTGVHRRDVIKKCRRLVGMAWGLAFSVQHKPAAGMQRDWLPTGRHHSHKAHRLPRSVYGSHLSSDTRVTKLRAGTSKPAKTVCPNPKILQTKENRK